MAMAKEPALGLAALAPSVQITQPQRSPGSGHLYLVGRFWSFQERARKALYPDLISCLSLCPSSPKKSRGTAPGA